MLTLPAEPPPSESESPLQAVSKPTTKHANAPIRATLSFTRTILSSRRFPVFACSAITLTLALATVYGYNCAVYVIRVTGKVQTVV